MKTTTTVRLPDSLLARAKKKAREEGATLTALIEEGLRMRVAHAPQRRVERVKAPISSVCGEVLSGIDLTSYARLQEIMDEEVIMQAGIVKLR
jgi:hypothetical protein